MKNGIKFLIMLIVAVVLFISSCDNKTEDKVENGNLIVKLTDTSVGDTTLYIDLNLVKVQYTINDSTEGAWNVLTTQDSIYNLGELQNGNKIVIAQEELEVGKITQLKLLLGENNSIITATDTFDVEVPLEFSSGIKIPINDSIVANEDLHIVLGFNSKSSVIDKSNGLFSLMPVITVIGDN